MEVRREECIVGWVDEWIDGWMDRWQDVWTDGLIDKFPLKGHLNS